jgi:hypothetical protein
MTVSEYAPSYDPLRFLDVPGHDLIDRERTALLGDGRWTVNNSSFDNYAERFGYDRADFRRILEETIGKDTNNVGIDIAGGANGKALQQLLEEGFLGRALLTNYQDKRWDMTKELPSLDHIDGDLLERQTWQRIIEWQRESAPEGFALVLHRPVGALQNLRPGFYRGAIQLLLDITKPNGVIFAQIPKIIVGGSRVDTYLGAIYRGITDRDDVSEIHAIEEQNDPITFQTSKGFICIVKAG